jgi:hypothetical protein
LLASVCIEAKGEAGATAVIVLEPASIENPIAEDEGCTSLSSESILESLSSSVDAFVDVCPSSTKSH